MILGWFFATRIRIRFIEADPDLADQNEMDPYGSGSATLLLTDSFSIFVTFNWQFLDKSH